MSKDQKNYKLTIQDPLATQAAKQLATEISYPLQLDFDVSRAIGGALKNEATFKIYNLAETTQAGLVKDRFNIPIFGSTPGFRFVSLEAGYQKNLYPVFQGNLMEGFSYRSGVNMVTQLHSICGAYGIFNSFINKTYGSNTLKQDVLNDIVQQLIVEGNIEKGAITPIDGEFTTGYTAMGNAFDILTEQFGYVFVDLNKINILKANEVINKLLGGKVFLIEADTGLLGTPLRRETFLEVRIMFEPQIQLGQLVEIKSLTDTRFNGQYKVYGINHSGSIGAAGDKETVTTLQLWLGYQLANGFTAIT
ncbi:MAG: baseplate hub protein [Flavobacterium sp.]